MLKDLLEIKRFILDELHQEIKKQKKTAREIKKFSDGLDYFLTRLADDKFVTGDQRACRQLLCSIGIDLKHKTVSPNHYYQIFSRIDFYHPVFSPRKLFNDVVFNDGLEHLADLKETTNFCVFLFPAKDYKYYLDPTRLLISSSLQTAYRVRKIKEYIQKKTPVLKITEFNKGTPLNYFWLSTEKAFEEIVAKGDINPVLEIVDRLGLSHFNFSDEGCQFFFYIDTGKMAVKTFKPNATMVNWNSNTGFLSYFDKMEGKTFCISGYNPFLNGLPERTFNRHIVAPEDLTKMQLSYVETAIETPIVSSGDIIQEGITRFKQV